MKVEHDPFTITELNLPEGRRFAFNLRSTAALSPLYEYGEKEALTRFREMLKDAIDVASVSKWDDDELKPVREQLEKEKRSRLDPYNESGNSDGVNGERVWDLHERYLNPEKKIEGGNKPKEAVNHPSHYNSGKIEVIDFIEDQRLGFSLGNAVKYIARAGKKDPAKYKEDLKKAAWYLARAIEGQS